MWLQRELLITWSTTTPTTRVSVLSSSYTACKLLGYLKDRAIKLVIINVKYFVIIARTHPLKRDGCCTFGVLKGDGGFKNLEIKGVNFQVRPPYFSRGSWTLIKGNTLSWIWKVPYDFKMFRLRRAKFLCFCIYIWWDNNQVLVIIVASNFSDVKNNIS